MKPTGNGIAVESEASVIDIARHYFDFPGSNSNWQIIHADIRQFLPDSQDYYDFILFDIEEQGRTPAWMLDSAFLNSCQQHLSEQGVVTFNIVASDKDALVRALRPIRRVFADSTYCLANR